MPYTPPDDAELFDILRTTRTIAIVGMSDDPGRASNQVARYLLSPACDYEHVWFVNPKGGEILGQPVYTSLAALPDAPDLVDVFRRSPALPGVAAEVVDIPGTKVFWAQLGLWSDEAAEIIERSGRRAVMDRCTKIDHARFPELHPDPRRTTP